MIKINGRKENGRRRVEIDISGLLVILSIIISSIILHESITGSLRAEIKTVDQKVIAIDKRITAHDVRIKNAEDDISEIKIEIRGR